MRLADVLNADQVHLDFVDGVPVVRGVLPNSAKLVGSCGDAVTEDGDRAWYDADAQKWYPVGGIQQ
jgi:hypothetical protein